MTATASAGVLGMIEDLKPTIHDLANECERLRRLPDELVRAFTDAGLFRLWAPREHGGLDADPLTFGRVVEAAAEIDGSIAWNLMIGAGNAILSGWLSPEVNDAIFGTPETVIGGVFGPRGKAVAAEGGYRVTGRWPFGSGGQHCNWMCGGCFVYEADGETRRLDARGNPATTIPIFPRGTYEILDTWDVTGLRGSGSHDYETRDLFVPREYCMSFADTPRRPEPLFKLPRFGLLAAMLTSVGTGIARHAIDTLKELAGVKRPANATGMLRDRGAVQADVARAESMLEAVRAYRGQQLGCMWPLAVAGESPTTEQRALFLAAAAYVSVTSAQVVDLMYNAGGATSIYEASPLARCFRDVHVATQHAMIQPVMFEPAGKALLGFDATAVPFLA